MKKNHIQGMVPHMNKIEAFVTNIQKQVIDAMGYVGGCSSRLIRIDGEFDPQEAIRAYLTASDAEREPVASSDVRELVDRLEKVAGRVRINNGSFSDIAHEAATALTDLEAENARLKAEVERLEKADETRAQDISRLTIERDAARDRLAEALKALEPFAEDYEKRSHLSPGPDIDHWPIGEIINAYDAARRVRE